MLWKLVTSGGAVALIAGFFLVWISVAPDVSAVERIIGSLLPESARSAIGSPRLRYSGLELATGPQIKTPFGAVGQLAGTTELWAAPVLAVAAVASAWSIRAARTAALAVLAEGLFGGGLLLIGLQRLSSEKIPFTAVSPEIGLWITLIGLGGVIVGALVGLARPSARRTEAPMTG